MADDWLPPLMELTSFGGDVTAYLAALYAVFTRDFITTKPLFRGRRLGLKRHPLYEGKEATFWHMITEGENEAARDMELRRSERLPWARPVIEAAGTDRVNLWAQDHQNETRWVISLLDYSYVVVVADRTTYALPWTAYAVTREHRRSKLQRQHAAWLAAKS